MIVDLGIRRFKDLLKYQNNDEIKEYKETHLKSNDEENGSGVTTTEDVPSKSNNSI